jgi:hypothetical protein
MPHLTLEDLARIVDDGASDYEAEHLAACDACRASLEEMREDVQALAMLPDMAVAPDAWPALEQRLAAEGLIRTRARTFATPWYMHAAAAVVLFLAGTMAGRLTAGPSTAQFAGDGGPAATSGPASYPAAPALPVDRDNTTLATAPDGSGNDTAGVPDARSSYDVVGPDAVRVTDDAIQPRPAPAQNARQRPVTFAANNRPAQPRSVEEAADLLRQTEEEYLSALTRYAELAMQSGAGDPVARLAALQSIVLTTQAALSQAPTDPVINGYHLNALAQRDAALRQVASASGDRWY